MEMPSRMHAFILSRRVEGRKCLSDFLRCVAVRSDHSGWIKNHTWPFEMGQQPVDRRQPIRIVVYLWVSVRRNTSAKNR